MQAQLKARDEKIDLIEKKIAQIELCCTNFLQNNCNGNKAIEKTKKDKSPEEAKNSKENSRARLSRYIF